MTKRPLDVDADPIDANAAGPSTAAYTPDERRKKRRLAATDPVTYQAKIDKRLGEIQDITDAKVGCIDRLAAEGVFAPYPSSDLPVLLERLQKVAQESGLLFPAEPTLGLVMDTLPGHTIDLLFRLLTDFWGTSGDHPALTKVQKEDDEDAGGFRLYLRIRKTTMQEMQDTIHRMRLGTPVNTPALAAMERSFTFTPPTPQEPTHVYEKYVGESVVSAAGRQKHDLQSAARKYKTNAVSSRWINRLSLLQEDQEQQLDMPAVDEEETLGPEMFEIYTVDLGSAPFLQRPAGYTLAQSKFAVPEWGILEFLFILVCAGRSWNSAPGGNCLMWAVPPQQGLSIANALPNTGPDIDLHEWMLRHFKRFHAAFNKRSKKTMSDAAIEQAALDATPSIPSGAVIRIAKDITIYAAMNLGNWWEVTAGAGPKLLRYLIEMARRSTVEPITTVDPFTFWTAPFDCPPAIMDYWAVTTIHTHLELADAFVALLFEKCQPRLIISASEKVHHMLVSDQFVLPEHPDTANLLSDGSSDVDVDVDTYARSVRRLRSSAGSSYAKDVIKEDPDEVKDDILSEVDDPVEIKDEKPTSPEDDPVKPIKPEDDPVKPIKPEDDPVKPIEIEDDADTSSDDGSTDDGSHDGEQDDDDDDDDDDRQWKDMQTGKFISLCGSINVVSFGVMSSGVSRSAVSITTIEPGYYKYSPVLQRTLLPLYLSTEMLCEIATRIVTSTDLDTDQLYEAITNNLEVRQVLSRLEEQKVIALRHVKAIGSLSHLNRALETPEQAQHRFDLRSSMRIDQRANYLANQVKAEGPPNSHNRTAQLLRLMADATFVHDNPHCAKGSSLWTEILGDVEEGKSLMLTWHRSRPASNKVHESMAKARAAIEYRKPTGPVSQQYPGWNASMSLEEVLQVGTQSLPSMDIPG